MDLSFVQELIPNAAAFFNIEPATALLLAMLVATICNIVGRQIPDDKTGPLGVIRDLCKLIGAYTPNKTTSGAVPYPTNPPVTPAFPGFKREQSDENDSDNHAGGAGGDGAVGLRDDSDGGGTGR